jgi:hypothetical protein
VKVTDKLGTQKADIPTIPVTKPYILTPAPTPPALAPMLNLLLARSVASGGPRRMLAQKHEAQQEGRSRASRKRRRRRKMIRESRRANRK